MDRSSVFFGDRTGAARFKAAVKYGTRAQWRSSSKMQHRPLRCSVCKPTNPHGFCLVNGPIILECVPDGRREGMSDFSWRGEQLTPEEETFMCFHRDGAWGQ